MIHPRITFVTAETVATLRGVSRTTVYDWVDGGGQEFFGQAGAAAAFMWVFNVGVGDSRELRFWAREIDNPTAVKGLTLPDVIRRIVPRRDGVAGQYCGLQNWEVGELLRVSRGTLVELRTELEAVALTGGVYVPRLALEQFLTRRWIFQTATAKKLNT